MESRTVGAVRLFPFYIGAAVVTVAVAAPGFSTPGTLLLAYTKQGKDDEKNQNNGDCGNNWIVLGHKAKERRRLAAPCICGFFGGKVADGIPSNGNKSADE